VRVTPGRLESHPAEPSHPTHADSSIATADPLTVVLTIVLTNILTIVISPDL
jgi:hypothetical protein